MIRTVLDVNVFVSAAIVEGGAHDRIVRAWRENRIAVIISPVMIEDLADVLKRRHIRRRYRITDHDAGRFLRVVRSYATIVPGRVEVAVVKKDPDDDAVIAAAVEGAADYIVTGDPHLLEIGSYAGIRIVTPAQFWRILTARENDNTTPPI